MGQLEDIERLRKKRNRRQNLKRLGTFLLVLAIFFGIWFVWEKTSRQAWLNSWPEDLRNWVQVVAIRWKFPAQQSAKWKPWGMCCWF